MFCLQVLIVPTILIPPAEPVLIIYINRIVLSFSYTAQVAVDLVFCEPSLAICNKERRQ